MSVPRRVPLDFEGVLGVGFSRDSRFLVVRDSSSLSCIELETGSTVALISDEDEVEQLLGTWSSILCDPFGPLSAPVTLAGFYGGGLPAFSHTGEVRCEIDDAGICARVEFPSEVFELHRISPTELVTDLVAGFSWDGKWIVSAVFREARLWRVEEDEPSR